MSSSIRTTNSHNNETGEEIESSEYDKYININCEQHGTLIKICVVLATTLIIATISLLFLITHMPLNPSHTKDTFSSNTHKTSGFSGENVNNKASELIETTSIEKYKTFLDEGDCCKFLYVDYDREHLGFQGSIRGIYSLKSKFNGMEMFKSERFDSNIAWNKDSWAIGANPNMREYWVQFTSVCSAFCIEECSSKDWKGLDINVHCYKNQSHDLNPCSGDRPLRIAGSGFGQISFPNNYRNPFSDKFGMCEWRISGRFGYIIKITILGLNLNKQNLFIIDGEDASEPVIGGFHSSNDAIPEPMFSSGLKFGINESKYIPELYFYSYA